MPKRASDVAKELGLSNNEFVALVNEKFPELGITSHSSNVSSLYVEPIKEHVRKKLVEQGRDPDAPGAAPAAGSAAAARPAPAKPAAAKPPPARPAKTQKAIRLSELATELCLENSELLDYVKKGFGALNINSHSSNIPGAFVEEVKKFVAKQLKEEGRTPPSREEFIKLHMAGKRRASDIAKDFGLTNNEVVETIQKEFPQFGVKSHSNNVPGGYLDDVYERIRKKFANSLTQETHSRIARLRDAVAAEVKKALGEAEGQGGDAADDATAAANGAKVAGTGTGTAGSAAKSATGGAKSAAGTGAETTGGLAPKIPPVPVAGKKVPPAPPVPARPAAAGASAAPVKGAAPAVPATPAAGAAAPATPAAGAGAAGSAGGAGKAPPPPLPLGKKAPASVPPPVPRPAAGGATAGVVAKPLPSAPPPVAGAKPKASVAPPPLPPRPAGIGGAKTAALPPPPVGAKVAPPPPPLPPRPTFGAKPSVPPPPPPAAGGGAKLPPPPVGLGKGVISVNGVPVRPAPALPPRPAAGGVKSPALPPLPGSAASKVPPALKRPGALPALPGTAAAEAEAAETSGAADPETASVAGDAGEAAAGAGDASSETAAAAPERSLPSLTVRPPIVVRDFAIALNIRPFRLISELMEMGIFAALGGTIEDTVAKRIAFKHGIALEVRHRGEAQQQVKKEPDKPAWDDPKFLEPRPPVVCVLGHVDHGKTTLLDYYRKSNVVAGEAGGITQHVGAYSVVQNGKKITFLDTPGHAAFSKMRERGAEITDIAILVVAADDGFMPQTDEALKFAQKNNVEIVVAINKTDAKGANVDRIKQQMQQRGIASEDWGGTVLTTPVSALKGDGMKDLLENVLLQAEVMDLKANPRRPVEGTVIEAQMETGRGPTATVIVEQGTLKTGDALVCGQHYCKVRALFDDHGKKLQSVAPGNPALVIGWSGVPTPGAVFQHCKNEREARELAEENTLNLRKALEEENDAARREKTTSMNRLSDMDRLMAAIASSKDKVFKVLCKADVTGTLEALIGALEGIKSDKVRLEVVAGSVGPITPNDVNVAHASGATIVAFDVKQENGVGALLKHGGTRVIAHNIIYMLLDNVRDAMAELLDPVLRENKVGMAEIRAIFPHGKNGFAAGCMVTEGSVRRDFKARIHRKGEVVHSGVIDTLKRFKDDATEVKAGYECGIRLGGFDAYEVGDLIECYEILQERPSL
jgi:translation initiation factor IF-2